MTSALCHKGPVIKSVDIFAAVSLIKPWKRLLSCRWFEIPWHSCDCNAEKFPWRQSIWIIRGVLSQKQVWRAEKSNYLSLPFWPVSDKTLPICSVVGHTLCDDSDWGNLFTETLVTTKMLTSQTKCISVLPVLCHNTTVILNFSVLVIICFFTTIVCWWIR